MAPPERIPLSGILWLGALTILWGSNWPAMKAALSEIDPWTFRTVCLVTGGAGLLAIARAGGHTLAIPRGERGPLCLAALFNITAWHLLSAYGLTLIQAGRAAIIAYTMPLWTVILSRVFLGEHLTRARMGALLLGFAGLGILMGPELHTAWVTPTGSLVMLGAAASWAAGTVVVKAIRWTIPTVVLTGWQVTLGAVPVLVGALLLQASPPLATLSLGAMLGTAYAALVGVILCHYAWFRVVHLLPSGIAAIGTLGVPAVGVLSSGLILGEPVGIRELVALTLVMAALGIVLVGPTVTSRA